MSGEVESLNSLYRMVHEKTGLDLKPYKEKFLRRRLAVRLRATHQRRLVDYLDYLEREDEELEKLMRCLTIHVSTFFRNPSTFLAIKEWVLPELFGRPDSRRIRFWSVGCARGEEPYSLAILIKEYLGESREDYDIQIQGIDVDEGVLKEAKLGEFSRSQLVDLDLALTQKYFMENGRYQLVPEIRNMVRFHCRDIFMAPPGGDYDFILCRNLLIYIEREFQELILERFHHALRTGGFLVLGKTEVLVGPMREAFEVVEGRERIYRKVR